VSNDLILHHYDASPFTQKALRMFGLKGLAWRSVLTPLLPPKDDLVALTGGYRGTPVLQIGADVYIDSQLIARELERLVPSPTFFPGGDAGLSLALVKWSDAFFRTGLKLALALLAPSWPEPFRKDRERLFSDIDFRRIGVDLPHIKSQFRAHAALLEAQLADGRAFLTGAAPGLADIQAHPFVWVARGAYGELASQLLRDFPRLQSWETRVLAIGEGIRTETDACSAFESARGATSTTSPYVDPHDSQQLSVGQRVSIEPDDSPRGAVEGELIVARPSELAVRRLDPRAGTVIVHFPRLGYRIRPLE
jgi:glutathione S-transferase